MAHLGGNMWLALIISRGRAADEEVIGDEGKVHGETILYSLINNCVRTILRLGVDLMTPVLYIRT